MINLWRALTPSLRTKPFTSDAARNDDVRLGLPKAATLSIPDEWLAEAVGRLGECVRVRLRVRVSVRACVGV